MDHKRSYWSPNGAIIGSGNLWLYWSYNPDIQDAGAVDIWPYLRPGKV